MAEQVWNPPDLSGQVAVVGGASKGVGRGIAEVLAECGARTYLVARSTDLLEKIADGIRERGGDAVVAPCDLGDDDAIDALFARITADDGHLEVLVNNAVGWGDHAPEEGLGIPDWMYKPPWRAPRSWFEDNLGVGVRSHWVTTNAAAPLLKKGRRGVVFFTSELRPDEPGSQEMVLDLRATAVERMALLFSLHLRPHNVSSILLYPGFTRTEPIERSFNEGAKYFEGWTADDFRSKTASTHYVGRAAAVLAADPDLLERTGTVIESQDAAAEYGFTDVDGTQLS